MTQHDDENAESLGDIEPDDARARAGRGLAFSPRAIWSEIPARRSSPVNGRLLATWTRLNSILRLQ